MHTSQWEREREREITPCLRAVQLASQLMMITGDGISFEQEKGENGRLAAPVGTCDYLSWSSSPQVCRDIVLLFLRLAFTMQQHIVVPFFASRRDPDSDRPFTHSPPSEVDRSLFSVVSFRVAFCENHIGRKGR